MQAIKLRRLAVFVFTILAVCNRPAKADGRSYESDMGFSSAFYLMGGQYHIYAHAKFGFSATRQSCFFGGNFSRVSPTPDTMHMGPVQLSTAIPYTLDLGAVNLSAGLYSLYIVSSTDCHWTFWLVSTKENSAGISSVEMAKTNGNDHGLAAASSLADTVQFSADLRTNHNETTRASGTMQILHKGNVVRTVPLQIGSNRPTRDQFFYAVVQWSREDTKSLGENTVRFTVKIGPQEFTSTGEFTLTE